MGGSLCPARGYRQDWCCENRRTLRASPPTVGVSTGDGRTREAVARLLMEQGPVTAAAVAAALELSAPAVRRHLDALIADGEAEIREASRRGPRGRGRPARQYLLTDAGRARFGHGYDDLAVSALRYLAEHGGESAVRGFAQAPGARADRAGGGTGRRGRHPRTSGPARWPGCSPPAATPPRPGPPAAACSCASTTARWRTSRPSSRCSARPRRQAFAELLGTHVQRLATIARGDSACTTHVPLDAPTVQRRPTTTAVPRKGRQSE